MPFVREMSHPPQRTSHQPQVMTTPPPPKLVRPRAPKIQQQSWDDCGPPSIQLYDPASVVVQHPSLPTLPPRSPTFRSALGQPAPVAAVVQSNPGRHTNNSSYNYYETRSPKSPRKFTYDEQRSPKFDYKQAAAGCSSGQQHPQQYQQQHQVHGLPAVPPRSPQITYSNGDGYDFYEMASFSSSGGTYETARRSPKAPKQFVFDAVSPRSEQQAVHPQHQQHQQQHQHHQQQQQQVTQFYDYAEESPPPAPPTFKFCTQRKSAQHNFGQFGNGDGNDDGYSTNSNAPKIASGSGNGGHPQQMPISDEHNHRPRLSIATGTTMTTTTTTESPYSEYSVVSGSGSCTGTGTSMCSTAAAGAVDSQRGGNATGQGGTSMAQRNSAESPPAIDSPGREEMALRGRGNRRHAINITSNPCYQVLHTSHSTLDRTCSDSIVALRNRQLQPCRKSTSDLTGGGGFSGSANGGGDDDDNCSDPTALPTANRLRSAHSGECGPSATGGGGGGGVGASSSAGGYQHRRRGSSKGGLAYLASRRNSRDSMKSAVSNTSIFSNEDIGPLAFQASARGRQRRTSNFLELPIPDHIRPRVCSLPERPYNPRQSDDLYRLRTFSISKGTVVNCGDSIISRRSRSNTSVNSTNSRASERSPFEGSCCGGGYANVDSVPASPVNDDSMDEPEPLPRYRVVMMGDAGVGKTALVSQFMTSEYMHTYDASLDDEFGEKTVSVLLDGEETEMIFIDHPSTEMSVENSLSTYEPHGCVVVYSVVHRGSFRQAEEAINYLWREKVTSEKTVILVGNKADLARSRVISMTEGKSLAQSRDSKFIETSSGIQHNVDELLVGILKQIRLKEQRDKKAAAVASASEASGSGGGSRMRNSRTQMSLHIVAKGLMQRIGLADITKSRSCENLLVL